MDYDVWYKGMIIANVEAESQSGATRKARRIYGPNVTTKPSK